jgi:catalase
MEEGAFHSYEERIDAKKIRGRSASFSDHFSQPALFYQSLAKWEQEHLKEAYIFELGKCTHQHIQERMLYIIDKINKDLAKKVAKGLGIAIPKSIEEPLNQAIGADADVAKFQPSKKIHYLDDAPTLSQANTKFDSIATRQIAVLAGDGFSMSDFKKMTAVLKNEAAVIKIIAPHGGQIKCDEGMEHKVDASIATTESVLYDAIYIPGGKASIDALMKEKKFIKFINEAFKHCKAIAVDHEAKQLLEETYVLDFKEDEAIFIDAKPQDFKNAIAKHRNWNRMENAKKIPV